jgi:pilus assembly protein CpaC
MNTSTNHRMIIGFAVAIFLGSMCLASPQAANRPDTASTIAAPAATEQVPATTAAAATKPSAEAEGPQSLHLLVGRSLVITSPTRIKRISIADPGIADAMVVSPYQILVNGKVPGGVSLLIWDETDQSQAFEVSVDIDVLGLSQKIHEVFPTENVHIDTSKDVVILTGKISSAAVADKILEVVKGAAPKVTSMMEVPTAPAGQILLQVKFAEVDRTKIDQLGFNFLSLPGAKNIGSVSTQQFGPPQLIGGQTTTGTSGGYTLSDLLNVFIFRPDINFAMTIKALQAKDVLQILAEPNLLTASGKEASFLAGGEFPFPILQGIAAGGTSGITIQFKEFGVRLNFTPTLTPDGTIHLKVKPEVSSLDFTNALTIQGFLIPALSTRRVESEMDLMDGQSFAIAGLVDNRVTEQFQKIPGIGDIPVLGRFFQSRTMNRSNSELLVLVTPRIVQPLTADKLPRGPVYPDRFLEPATPAQEKPVSPK